MYPCTHYTRLCDAIIIIKRKTKKGFASLIILDFRPLQFSRLSTLRAVSSSWLLISPYTQLPFFLKPKICSTQPSAMSFIKRRKSSSGFEPYNSIHSFPPQKIKDLKQNSIFQMGIYGKIREMRLPVPIWPAGRRVSRGKMTPLTHRGTLYCIYVRLHLLEEAKEMY